MECPGGHECPLEGCSKPIECPSGKYSSGKGAQCQSHVRLGNIARVQDLYRAIPVLGVTVTIEPGRCEAGSFLTNGKCNERPPGTFTNIVDATTCCKCAAGSFSVSVNIM